MHVLLNTTVLISIVVFLSITMVLVGVLLYIKQKLTPSGSVRVMINDQKEIEVSPGGSLLATLSSQGIYLPSACGGGGTCGLCRCKVLEGGGTILPTEVGFFTRAQIKDHWRLGCQVKVHEHLQIQVPEEILGICKWECEVISNRNVATFIKELVVKLPPGETLHFKSGGYIQIDIPPCEIDFSEDILVEEEYREDWDKMKIWDLKMRNPEPAFRAYSMANHPAEGNIIMLNIRIATPPWDRVAGKFQAVNPGICSSYVFSLKPGDRVTISGPYGEFFLKQTDQEMMFIGGGAGMAPMRSHLFHLFYTLQTGRKVTFWYGARSRKEIFYEQDFREIERKYPNFRFVIALSEPQPADQWTGPVGFIHQVIFDQYLNSHPAPEDVEYYLCGPPMMTDAVVKMLDQLGVPSNNVLYDNFGA